MLALHYHKLRTYLINPVHGVLCKVRVCHVMAQMHVDKESAGNEQSTSYHPDARRKGCQLSLSRYHVTLLPKGDQILWREHRVNSPALASRASILSQGRDTVKEHFEVLSCHFQRCIDEQYEGHNKSLPDCRSILPAKRHLPCVTSIWQSGCLAYIYSNKAVLDSLSLREGFVDVA